MTHTKSIKLTGAIGMISKSRRYSGTYAYRDIAFEFASWVSVEFKLYLIKEFQRPQEAEQTQLGWDIKRNLTKINYRIHTNGIALSKNHRKILIPCRKTFASPRHRIALDAPGQLLRIQNICVLIENESFGIHPSMKMDQTCCSQQFQIQDTPFPS